MLEHHVLEATDSGQVQVLVPLPQEAVKGPEAPQDVLGRIEPASPKDAGHLLRARVVHGHGPGYGDPCFSQIFPYDYFVSLDACYNKNYFSATGETGGRCGGNGTGAMNLIGSDSMEQSVLFEDNHLLVMAKPAGLLVQGDHTGRDNLLDLGKDYLKKKYNKPGRVFLGLVHRLDRQVAGVVVLARTSKAAKRLSAQFRERGVRKIYWAVVHGRPDPPDGLHELALVREGHKSVPAALGTAKAQPASLSYRTLDTGPGSSLLEIDLHTGRRHQIRAQLSALGHPILGDGLYGSPENPPGDSIGLLARSLTVHHPIGREPLTFECPLPRDWPWLPLR